MRDMHLKTDAHLFIARLDSAAEIESVDGNTHSLIISFLIDSLQRWKETEKSDAQRDQAHS